MPTSSACSQLQAMWPLNAKVWRAGRDEAVELGKGRRLAFAEIGPEDAALLDHGIGALPDVLAELRVLRLGRRLEALAGGVEQPAVEGAAQAAILQPAEGEIGAAMRAVAIDQAVAAALVAEQHEVLAEQLDRPDRALALRARRPAPPAASTSASACRTGPSARCG